jgi:tetratricopeptide (TPR) repeat protein
VIGPGWLYPSLEFSPSPPLRLALQLPELRRRPERAARQELRQARRALLHLRRPPHRPDGRRPRRRVRPYGQLPLRELRSDEREQRPAAVQRVRPSVHAPRLDRPLLRACARFLGIRQTLCRNVHAAARSVDSGLERAVRPGFMGQVHANRRKTYSHKMEEADLQAAIVAYLKGKLSTVPDPDALNVGIEVLVEAFSIDPAALTRPRPALLAAYSAGLAALGASPSASAAASVSEPATAASPMFAKFLESVTAKGFFADVKEGTPEYEERYKKVLAKFEERIAAGGGATVASAAPAPVASDEAGAEAAKEAGNKHVAAQRYAQAIECYSEAIEKAPASK